MEHHTPCYCIAIDTTNSGQPFFKTCIKFCKPVSVWISFARRRSPLVHFCSGGETRLRSIKTIKAGCKQKFDYYTKDESLKKKGEYYSESELESEEHKVTTAQWLGSASAALGLSGDVEQEKFEQVFRGQLPRSKVRIRGDRTGGKENLAVDMTLSAPKTFSMHALKDLGLYKDHMEACRRTLAVAEQFYCYQRRFIEGKQRQVKGNGFIAAAIPHWTSREMDMMLHSHVVIMNGCQGPDGKWRAFDDRPLRDAEWLGSYYRNELAKLVQARGYHFHEVSLPKGGYSFEIDGIQRVDIEHFSKRSQQIAEAAAEQQKDRDDVVISTRKAKRISQTWGEYRDEWLTEMGDRSMVLQDPEDHPVESLEPGNARAEVDYAIAHLSERSVSFRREDILKVALDHIKGLDMDDVLREIEQHPELIEARGKARFTTAEAVEREASIRLQWMAGQGVATPLNPKPELEGLNEDQAQAIAGIMASPDQHLIINGLSGTGKTTSLKTMLANLEGVSVKAYASTIEAAKVLQDELGISSNTVARLCLSKPTQEPNQLWIIDEAGMVSARQMAEVLSRADSANARILLVGDIKQNSAVEAGAPMRSLMDYGATTYRLSKIVRQQDDIQRAAVNEIATGIPLDAFNLLFTNGYLIEIENQGERAQQMAADYLALSPDERAKTLLVSGTNAERKAITAAVRAGLIQEGRLKHDITSVHLVNRQMTRAQTSRTENYRVGDYIRLNRKYRSTGLQKGELYKVEGIQGDELSVSSIGGRFYRLNPSHYKGISVFYAESINLAVGDQVRFTATDQDYHNGQRGAIAAIDDTSLTVIDQKGRSHTVNLMQPLHLDHDLVSTSYKAQGRTKKRVITSTTVDPTSSTEPFYVAISRQFQELKVYAEDLEHLREQIQRSNRQENPLELIGDLYDTQSRSTRPGNRPGNPGVTGSESPESAAPRAEPGNENAPQRGDEYHTQSDARRTGEFSGAVRGETGEPRTDRYRQSNPGAGRGTQGLEGAPDQLRTHVSGNERPGGIRRPGDQGVREQAIPVGTSPTAEAEGTAKLDTYIERLLSQLDQKTDDQLWSESGLVDELGEVVQSLDSYVNGSAQTEATPHQYRGLDRLVNALDNQEDTDLLAASELVTDLAEVTDQLQSLVPPPQTYRYRGMDRLTQAIARDHDQQNAESVLRAAQELVHELVQQLQPGNPQVFVQYSLEDNDHDQHIHRDRTRTGSRPAQAEPDLTGGDARGYHPTDRRFDWPLGATINDRQGNRTAIGDGGGKYRDGATANPDARAPERTTGADFSESVLSAIAAQVVEARLAQELAEPLQRLQAKLQLLAALKQARTELAQAAQSQRAKVLQAAQTELIAKGLREWRSLRQRSTQVKMPPELAKNLERYPAQKVMNFIGRQMHEVIPQTPKPQKLEPFWVPQYKESDRPSHIEVRDWEEFKRSAIHPAMVARNAVSLSDENAIFSRLLSERLEKLGSGQRVTRRMVNLMEKYKTVAEGGWYGTAGRRAQKLTEHSLWGTFKPRHPRTEVRKGLFRYPVKTQAEKEQRRLLEMVVIAGLLQAGINPNKFMEFRPIKYEHPLDMPRELYLPNVPDAIAQPIGDRYDLELNEDNLWQMVRDNPRIPIVITEGAKKTWASFSQGVITIGIPGVNALYQANDENGDRLPQRRLNPDILPFAVSGREFVFAFDQDARLSSVINVRRDLVRTIELLEERGCVCKVTDWEPEQGKGLDDLIAQCGPRVYQAVLKRASVETVAREKRLHYRTEYNRLARTTLDLFPTLKGISLDAIIRFRAIKDGDPQDGDRFMTQSDYVRENPAQLQQYLQMVREHMNRTLRNSRQPQRRKGRSL